VSPPCRRMYLDFYIGNPPSQTLVPRSIGRCAVPDWVDFSWNVPTKSCEQWIVRCDADSGYAPVSAMHMCEKPPRVGART